MDAAPREIPEQPEKNPLDRIRLGKMVWPILIGLGVVVWLFARDFDPRIFSDITFGVSTILFLLAALLFMAGRDVGYMWRIRALTDRQLSWRASFRVIMLWEFTSAITPSAVGGTSVAVIYVHKEGISVGRSSAIVMLTSFLDEAYFILMFPVVALVAGFDKLFDIPNQSTVASGLMLFAGIGYFLKLCWVLLMGYGLFFNPEGVKRLLAWLFKWRLLRRWRRGAIRAGNDIMASSDEIKKRKPRFWLEAGGSTFLSWTSRYLVANALIMAFFGVTDQFMLFARQLIMWIMMLVMPTPGGSGFSEWIFSSFCSDLIAVPVALQASAAALIAFLWRGVTYYPYLAIGAIVFPRWLKRIGSKKDEE